ncbi:MAG: tRNA (guanosine(46)-N7)-methyltransferase TrmB [Bacteroidetes bacterium]|nr:tRNA (guanosine(46)-N7)-methyltransferase TrmB [Bacteroidota bacterium]
MAQKKLIRFEEIKHFSNVLEYPENMAGNWELFFKNNHLITLELACGKGEYAVGLGKMYPQRNFIGVDIKGNRIWKGAKTALDEGLKNVAFLRTQIDFIDTYFTQKEVQEFWITFPDPQLSQSKQRKRLTHPKFLRLYKNILAPGGKIHLKTDSPDLYRFTKTVINTFNLKLLEDETNIYGQAMICEELKIKTFYESLDISGSKKVFYLCFQIDQDLPSEKDNLLKDES